MSRIKKVLDVDAVLLGQCLEGYDLEDDVGVPHGLPEEAETQEDQGRHGDGQDQDKDDEGDDEVQEQLLDVVDDTLHALLLEVIEGLIQDLGLHVDYLNDLVVQHHALKVFLRPLPHLGQRLKLQVLLEDLCVHVVEGICQALQQDPIQRGRASLKKFLVRRGRALAIDELAEPLGFQGIEVWLRLLEVKGERRPHLVIVHLFL